MTDPPDAIIREALRHQRFHDLVLCGDLALSADIRIQIVGQIGELARVLTSGARKKAVPTCLTGPSWNLKPNHENRAVVHPSGPREHRNARAGISGAQSELSASCYPFPPLFREGVFAFD